MAISTCYLELTGEPENTLRVIQSISSSAEDLDQWLADHEYLARAFRKFRYDVAPLRRFASDLVASRPPGAFFEYFRGASARVSQIRCVFAMDEADDRDYALRRHLEEDALGENFSEEMFVDARAHHIDMRNASVVVPLLDELVERVGRSAP